MSRRTERLAFTLIEMLVVIAIIAILAALLLPALKDAKERTRRISCGSNLHQVSIGLETYILDSDNEYPEGDWGAFEGFSRPTNVMPYFENPEAMFLCPSSPIQRRSMALGQGKWVPSHFGPGGPFSLNYYYLSGFGCLSYGCSRDPAQIIERFDGYPYYCCNTGSFFEPLWFKDKPTKEPHRIPVLMDIASPGRAHAHWTPPYFNFLGGQLDNHESLTNDPAGENVMFMDTRVEWLDFKGTKLRETKYRGRFKNYYITVYW